MYVEVYALRDLPSKRKVHGPIFLNILLQNIYESNFRLNNEKKLIEKKYIQNADRYDQNINVRLD